MRCQLAVKPGFKSGNGASLTGPGSHERIDEEQYFVLQLNGLATLQNVQAHISCAVEGG